MPLEPVEVEYCSLCTCPLEYCENAGCKRVKLEKEMEGVSVSGDGEKPKEAAADGEAADGDDDAKPKEDKKKKSKAKGVTITRTNRNKRKHITVVAGFEHFPEVDVKDASKKLGKKFACGASVTKGATGKDEIDIQGDFSHEVAAFITANFGVDADLIKLVDKGK
jgi:density-regulated protein DRP1